MPLIVALLLLSISPFSHLQAEEYQDVTVTKVLVTGKTSDGKKVRYPRTDDAEVTVLIVDVPPGGSTGWHSHPIPVYAYMLEGELAVEMEDGKTNLFRKGDAIIEMVDRAHNGYNPGKETAKLVVFYTGAVGVPNVIKEPATHHQTR
ncbi:MAG: cupin domain-containing protein [Chlorobium sp.]|nr:cupin domain-containing protein [Chlorobiaceae bacterium]MCF8216860.1 cupin domain-containing protein [Chlorobium sp.]MCF8270442.1 cupin domain-containing protein [Chlorobium sp.]MCF8288077.1 cupin domain-containing protein [Chlorobium sp.]MCF8290410.1 cupin domain-containing protein [Chlorobium sp.]